MEMDESDELWDYMPLLPAISIAICGFFLIKKWKNGEITFATLKIKFLKLTGEKALKFTVIAVLMTIPVVNVVVGAGILFKLLYGAGSLANRYVD